MQTPELHDDERAPLAGLLHVHPLGLSTAGPGAEGSQARVESERLTIAQLRSVSAQWRGQAAGGDRTAGHVADAIDWIASQRTKQEVGPTGLTDRVSQWMGL